MANWEKLLNSEQLKAVKDTEGAVLVLAGAGSGKTRVLTYRIAYLIAEKGVAPENILAVTFTNKAAAEMSKRVLDTVGVSGTLTTTFHSFCARVLRHEAEKIGYTQSYTIYDAHDSEKLIKRILTDKRETDKEAKERAVNLISSCKSKGISPEDALIEFDYMKEIDFYVSVYQRYEELLKEANAMDFDDLLLNTLRLFTAFPDTLAKYQRRFRYVLVDEFQDTNRLQYEIIRLLTLKSGNLFVVGDDDQSIYSWRGAEVTNMTGFRKAYPDSRIYKLEQNYRSTPEILTVANKIIANNSDRIGKELWTENSGGTKVEIKAAYSDREEAEFVVSNIIQLMRYNGYKPSDFAILTRINSITRLFEERLTMYNVAYKVFGGFKFYERAEIKDMLAYMRIAVNPRDNEAILRVINTPARGIGDTSIEKMLNLAEIRGERLHDIILDIDQRDELAPSLRKKVSAFREILNDIMNKSYDLPADEFANYIFERVGFDTFYDKNDEEEGSKLENIQEFISGAHEFVKENPNARVVDFLQSVSLISDTDGMDEGDYVTISTVHMAKGLEFKVVFIVGLEEDIMPSSRALTEEGGVEEERRIMYVAVTRAKERLFLTTSSTRFRFGQTKTQMPSRFLRESGLLSYKPKPDENVYLQNKKSYTFDKPVLSQRPAIVQKGSVDVQKYKIGQKVKHARFGVGRIINIEGVGDNKFANIAFDGLGIKKFSLAITPMEIID